MTRSRIAATLLGVSLNMAVATTACGQAPTEHILTMEDMQGICEIQRGPDWTAVHNPEEKANGYKCVKNDLTTYRGLDVLTECQRRSFANTRAVLEGGVWKWVCFN